MRRTVLLGLSLTMILAGCASTETDPAPGADGAPNAGFDRRATEVAGAWRPGPEWATGYLPLQEPVVLIGAADFTPATKTAFLAGWYRNLAELPTTPPAEGAVRFPDGKLAVPLISAAEAYRELTHGNPAPCPLGPKDFATPPPAAPPPDEPAAPGGGGPDETVTSRPQGDCVALTVTEVELGTAPVRTSRGEAQVPAWLFTVKEIDAVVARVAVAPSAVAAIPEPAPPSGSPPEGLVSAQDLQAVDGAHLTFRLGVGSCDTGVTPLVQEHDHVVVVGGTVIRPTGVCNDALRLEPVEVTLTAPLGARPILDALTGTPLRLTTG
ncbi:hypothetical protein [Micromonospora endophytica]|uniref:Uncharacterized protein n=1 Tax=Micromonospora endophytica TaxID=515350 RepID=A0A2W2BVR1_9ACTN|nr:hypothetical protein [Micromonospora endophytica]PZF89650.1 hypothetical protein C1I93_23740 [Micromonospora endophytica]RIW50815.1 hypothetical protein D3H59_01475 [Micromonospora endophytica]BCJ58419.1 hypothetical protein Jiend_18410 [Micromonospora endophytica]